MILDHVVRVKLFRQIPRQTGHGRAENPCIVDCIPSGEVEVPNFLLVGREPAAQAVSETHTIGA